MNKKIITGFCLAFFVNNASALETYLGGGTTGFFIGIGQDLSDHIGVRVEGNYLEHDENLKTSDIKYNASLNMKNIGAFLDYHPFKSSGFRLTAGALIGQTKITGYSDTSEGILTIKGRNYPVPTGESLYVEGHLPKIRPFLGFGFTPKSKFGIFADLGVAYGGISDISLKSSQLVHFLYGSKLEEEKKEVKEKMEKYQLYPVARVGVQYRF